MQENKRFFKPEGLNLDKLCYKWYLDAREQNMPITGTLIRSKAKEIALTLKYDNFKASSGWLEKFKRRHKIQLKPFSSESDSVSLKTEEVVDGFAEKLPQLLQGFECSEVYNPNDANAFFENFPNQMDFDMRMNNTDNNSNGIEHIKMEPDCNIITEHSAIKFDEGISNDSDVGLEEGISSYKEARSALKKLKMFALKTKDLKGYQLSMALQMHFENISVMREYFKKEC